MMRRAAQVVGKWRPRKGAALAGVVLAIGAAGVGWAATRATSPSVITACVDPAGGPLVYSASGSCGSGQTTVQWDMQGPQGQQGPQGPPGLNGAAAPSSGVVAWGPSNYTNGFTITAQITSPGTWVIDGSVSETVTPLAKYHRTFRVACALLTGPPNGNATALASSIQAFVYHKATQTFTPPGFTGPVDEEGELAVARAQTPTNVYFSCRRLIAAGTVVYVHPTITIEAAVTPTFHQRVGPALPFRPIIGPGPLKKVLGN
jgi:hypothetical protein